MAIASPKHLVTITIGIQDYEHPHYGQSHARLRYAVRDAEWFHSYCEAIGTSFSSRNHSLLCDREAVLTTLHSTPATSSSGPDADLLLVYLTGHGDRDDYGNGWFCLSDAEPQKPSLDSTVLDSILEAVKCKATRRQG